MTQAVYRQRLTDIGHLGIVLSILGALVSGIMLPDIIFSLSRGSYGPALVALLASIASFAGLVMILIGREYYPVMIEEEDAADDDTSESPMPLPPGVFYPGQPLR